MDDSIVCERYISDFTGHDICPGNVVGVGRVNKSNFEAKIVTKIRTGRIYFAGYIDKYEDVLNKDGDIIMEESVYKWGVRAGQTYQTPKRKKVTYLNLHQHYSSLAKKQPIQEHITIVSEPLFAIHNPQIKKLLEMADKLKDLGLFPSDYKLGQTLVEYQEKEE